MITLKKLNATEQDIRGTTTQFLRMHPVVSIVLLSVIIVITVATILLTLATGGSGCLWLIDTEFCMSDFWVMDKLIISIILFIPLYILYKFYLKYKHNNL